MNNTIVEPESKELSESNGDFEHVRKTRRELHNLRSSVVERLVRVFLMRSAVRRAAPLLYQHSFINLAITRRA